MEEHYCINCGMPIPRKTRICPECGASQILIVPRKNTQQSVPYQRYKPRSTRRAAVITGLCFAAVAFFVGFVVILFAADVPDRIKRAHSRHLENQMDAERMEKEKAHPKISIPEISMPEIHIPEIHLPEPPAAEFAAESYTVETNLAGQTVLYVNISYTNRDGKAQCFLTGYRISVQQDGEACRQTAGNPKRENHLMSLVQPEETALVSEAFVISAEKETTVSVSAYFGGETYLEETVIPHADGSVTVVTALEETVSTPSDNTHNYSELSQKRFS